MHLKSVLFKVKKFINRKDQLLFCTEKLASEEKSSGPVWELTNPIPLNDDGSSVEHALGKNPDVHYIYICVKVID